MGKRSSHQVRELLDAERDRVLGQLRVLARKDAAAREKEQNRRRKFRTRAQDLVSEGKQLGVPVTELAEAAGVTRQMAHSWLRNGATG